MDEPTRILWAERAVRAVDEAFPTVDFANWSQCERLLPQALACAEHIEHSQMTFLQAARLLNATGYYLNEQGRYTETEPLYERALAIREQQLGPAHPNTAQSLNNLALLYNTQGKYEQAEPLLRRALAIYEQRLGARHPTTRTIQSNYDRLLGAMGKRSG